MGKLVPKSISFPPPPEITRIVVWSSTNEVDWTPTGLLSWWSTQMDLDARSPNFGIAYGNSIFVAVLSTSQIYTSTDGVAWTTSQPLTNSLYNVAFGAGQFVIVGQEGVILTSGNGIDWTARNCGTSSNLYGVQFGNQTFLATDGSPNVWRCDLGIRLNMALSPAAQLTISGPTGAVYRIEAVAGLHPKNSWEVLTNIAVPFSPYTWTDVEAPVAAMRYYRAVMLMP